METNLPISELVDNLDNALIKSQLHDQLHRVAKFFAPSIADDQAVDTIYDFLRVYIKMAPELINTLKKIRDQYNINTLIEPCLGLATNYLSAACTELIQDNQNDSLRSFLTLLQGAYIFHRLIEELDERIRNFIGLPLTHFDMMNANLITHDIIGDKFANHLDQITISMFREFKITTALIEAQLDKPMLESFQKLGQALSGQPISCIATQYQLSLTESRPKTPS